MEDQNEVNKNTLNFDYAPTAENKSIIKVVGVGGGGSNAVTHMYESNIEDVTFLIINTDWQALKGSPIPNKLLISEKGLGAGAKPDVAEKFALEYSDQIKQALSDGTEMIFITAGMGGGTGTGAAPVVAKIAHEMGILTVGIVTIPFRFEGRRKILMALDGVNAIKQWCDALLVVNNNRLIDVYPDLNFDNAFARADDTLTTAAKSISDIINKRGYINLDFADVSTTLRNGGVALISTGTASGDNRLTNAIKAATSSPLLQDNNYTDAQHLLFELCFSHANPLSMAEMEEMNLFVDGLNSEIDVIWGAMHDDSLGDEVRIILLASGFSMDETGKVIAGDQAQARIKAMQTTLRNAINESKERLIDFDGYSEAVEILQAAQRLATQKADSLTIDDNLEEETSKLAIALEKATQIKDEAIAKKAEEEAKAAEEQRQKEIERKMAEYRAQLESQLPTTAPAQQTEPKTVVPQSIQSEPTLFDAEPEPEPVQQTPEVDVAPRTEPATNPNPAPAPRTATDALSGIDAVRRFYGEEMASRYELADTRKSYYVLDDKDLTNEQLVELLRKLPAYNRTLEDLGQLRAVSRQPQQPKVIGHHDNPDGTIQF